MAEDALLRLENLRRFMDAHKPPITGGQLAIDLQVRKSFTSELLAGRKAFGEKLARKIEAAYGLPRGWLDEADSPVDAAPVTDWPFERISPQAWAGLTERQRGAIEAAAVAAMREVQSVVAEDLSRKQPARGA
jgi:hypothetical protein